MSEQQFFLVLCNPANERFYSIKQHWNMLTDFVDNVSTFSCDARTELPYVCYVIQSQFSANTS